MSASTQNQALSAVLFLYRHVLAIELDTIPPVVRAKTPERLPVVLGRSEVASLLGQLSGALRLIVTLLYGAGLRLDECLGLRVKDLDFERDQITVPQGKGRKDRVTMLPASAKDPLRAHLEDVRRVHAGDLANGLGRVVLPYAIERKSPGAATDDDIPSCVAARSARGTESGGSAVSGYAPGSRISTGGARIRASSEQSAVHRFDGAS